MQCFYAYGQGAWELSDEYQIFLWQSCRYIYNTTSYFIMQFLYTCGQGPWGALMGVRFYWPCSPVFFLGPTFPFVYLAAIGGWSIEARVWLWAVLSCGPSVLLSLWPCFLGSVGCRLAGSWSLQHKSCTMKTFSAICCFTIKPLSLYLWLLLLRKACGRLDIKKSCGTAAFQFANLTHPLCRHWPLFVGKSYNVFENRIERCKYFFQYIQKGQLSYKWKGK